jgi:hypothetical protein
MEKLTDQEKQVIVGLISRVNVSPIDENAEENIKVLKSIIQKLTKKEN